MDPSDDTLRRWAGALGYKPVHAVLGPLDPDTRSRLEALTTVKLSASRSSSMGDIFRLTQNTRGLVLLPSYRGDRAILQSQMSHLSIVQGETVGDVIANLRETIHAALGECVAPEPTKSAKDRDQLQPGHHCPDGFYNLAREVAGHREVTRVRFYKFAGREMTVDGPKVGRDDIRIDTRDRAGLVVNYLCGHQVRVISITEDLRVMLNRHIR